jgi:hypothetical protein
MFNIQLSLLERQIAAHTESNAHKRSKPLADQHDSASSRAMQANHNKGGVATSNQQVDSYVISDLQNVCYMWDHEKGVKQLL